MPNFAGKNLYVNYGGTVISGDVSQVTLPDSFDTHETSGGGDTRKSYVVGLGDNNVSAEGPFNTDLTSAHFAIAPLLGDETGALLTVGPAGSASTRPKQSGTMIVESYEVTSPVNGAVRWRAGFKPTNGVGMSWGTFV